MPTPSSRWTRLLISVLVGGALLLGAAYVLLAIAFPPQRLAGLLSEQVRQATGRSFTLQGDLSLRLLPRIGVDAGKLAFGNAAWGSRPDMLRVEQAQFDLALWPLLQGKVALDGARFRGVDLLLETDRNGVGNWVMTPPGGAPAPSAGSSSAGPVRLHLSRLSLEDARLGYRDGRSGRQQQLQVQQLLLTEQGDGQQLQGRAQAGTQSWKLSGHSGRIEALAGNDADWPFDLQLETGGLSASAKGLVRRGALPRAVEADLSLNWTQAGALAGWWPAAARVPLPVQAQARLRVAGNQLRADNLSLAVAQQAFTGQLGLQTVAPWKLDLQLAGGQIDAGKWGLGRAPAAGKPGAAPGGRVFDDTPLGLGDLPDLPASVALRIDRLLIPGLPPLANLNLQLNNQPGRLRIDPFSTQLAGGSLRGSLGIAQAGNGAPKLSLQAQGSNLALDDLLQASGHSAFARGGQLQLRADLALAGDTPRALAAGANGELLLSLNDTTLGSGLSPLGTDVLQRLLQAVTLKPQTRVSSQVRCAVMRLPLRNGVAAVDRSIALETDQLALSAKGQIRFDDETLALAFQPSARGGGNNPLDLAQLVVLRGPWRDPTLGLDAQGVATMAASIGLAGATGGLSLLAQQFVKSPQAAQPCQFAATGTGAPAAAAPAPAGPRPTSPQPAPRPALPQGLDQLLRGLGR